MQADENIKFELKKLKEQWDSFVEFNIVMDGVEPQIAQSWVRSKAYNIDPYHPKISLLSETELQTLKQENQDLIRLSKPLMNKLLILASDTVNVMSLHDKDGYMLDIAYHKKEGSSWREDVFRPGVRWTEADVGTNGVGLALVSDCPVQIFGPEHYCYMQREISCSAAPIHNEEGKIIGVLNVSGPFTNLDRHLLALVAYGAYSIESQISLYHNYEFINTTLNVISESLLLFNSRLSVIRCSRQAARMFQAAMSMIVGMDIDQILNTEGISEQIQKADKPFDIQELQCCVGETTISCRASITPMIKRGKLLGGTVLLRESKKMNKLANLYAGNFSRYTFSDIITRDPQILETIEAMKRAAKTDCGILIEGESGTGKELFAHAIHSYSPRRDEPFIAINCASIPQSLVESELFGYEKGSFSGALNSGNPGKFELANGGTIFLDEIGELPLEIQSKLLRVIETHRVTRIGGKLEKELDIRIIAATNRNLLREVSSRNFRNDLYYRLNIFEFKIPPLRERKDDVELLTTFFIGRLNQKENDSFKKASPELIAAFQNYSWPGNVRELQNMVSRLYYNCLGGWLTPDNLNAGLNFHMVEKESPFLGEVPQYRLQHSFSNAESEERRHILDLLYENEGDVNKTAERLGLSRATMYRRLSKYQINPKNVKKGARKVGDPGVP